MPAKLYGGKGARASRLSASEVFEQIVAGLMKGEILPGEIIEDNVLVRKLGASPRVLKMALEQLRMRKLAERVRDTGSRVRTPLLSEIREVYEIRKALEGLACRMAATAMTGWELDQLELLIDLHEKDPRLIAGTEYPNDPHTPDFHFLIVCGSRNSRLIELLCDEVYYQARLYRSWAARNPSWTRQALDEHKEILTAMRMRDAPLAETVMRRHIQNSFANMVSGKCWKLTATATPSRTEFLM